MENLNFHKQKLYALIVAGVGLISMFLPWWKISFGGYGGGFGGLSTTVNGLHELGIISLLGFIGAGVATFAMGDKTKPYEGQVKMITAACFGGAGLIALIQFLRQTHFASFGIFLAIAAGAVGALWVWGIIKMPQGGATPKA